MKNFRVTVIRLSDNAKKTIDVIAFDKWQAQTVVWFKMPRGWANGSEVEYAIKELYSLDRRDDTPTII